MMEKPMTVVEMGKALGICRNSAYKLASSPGFFPAFRIGRRVLIDRESLKKWIEESGKQKERK